MGSLTLVTGASGHLGANLVRRVLADGERVRVMLRWEADRHTVAGLPVEVVVGDLRDADAATVAVRGCGRAYHCAALVSTLNRDHSELFSTNVLGTRNLLAAALGEGIEKVVVSGSFSATGHTAGMASDETMPFNGLERHLPYSHTKAAMEHECLKFCAEGLPVVVAVSTAILGPWDFRPSRMGQVLIRFAQGRLRVYSPGGFEFVSAADIAEGHLLAMARGKPGRKYIFATQFLTFDDIMNLFAEVTGQRRMPRRLPPRLVAAAAGAAERILPVVAPRREQLLTSAAVRILRMERRADTRRAREDLGFRPGSIESAVREAYHWFRERGMVADPPLARASP